MARQRKTLTYPVGTAIEDGNLDAQNPMLETKAVYPELPSPFKHMYVKIKDLNRDSDYSRQIHGGMSSEDRREHPALEVGLRITF